MLFCFKNIQYVTSFFKRHIHQHFSFRTVHDIYKNFCHAVDPHQMTLSKTERETEKKQNDSEKRITKTAISL